MTTIRVLRVIARREGFRRAGLVFGSSPREVALDALTVAQRTAIEGDPMLLATEVEVAAAAGNQAEVPPEGADATGSDEAGEANPGVAVGAVPRAGRKRK